jgi:polyisoprenoid-binding protein YceI
MRRHFGAGHTLWLVISILLGVQFIAARVIAETYAFSGGHSSIVIGWDHAGLSRHSARIVGIDGVLEFDPLDPSAANVDVKIEPARISTGVPALDRVLRSADFFDATASPLIAFRSTAVVVTGERTGDVTGDLTIRGETKPVTLAVRWNFSGEHPLGLVNPSFAGKFVSGFSATTRLRRSEWGLGRGAPLISDEVDLAIEVEAVRR